LKNPTARQAPVMISHNGLVCFPAAGKAAVGRRTASAKAHASMTKAATSRIQFTHVSGVNALKVTTVTIYRLLAADGSVHGSASEAATAAASGSCPDSSMASATAVLASVSAALTSEPARTLALAAARASASVLTSLRNDS